MPALARDLRLQLNVTLVDAASDTLLCPPAPNSLCCAAYDVHPSDAGCVWGEGGVGAGDVAGGVGVWVCKQCV